MPQDDLPILDMSNPHHKRVLKGYIDGLHGLYRFEFIKCRDQRSLKQNAYLHGVVFTLVARALTELCGEPVSMLAAKELMKDRFLRHPRINKRTGEVHGCYTRDTSDLDKEECATFINQVIAFAADKLWLSIPAPGEYEREDDGIVQQSHADGESDARSESQVSAVADSGR